MTDVAHALAAGRLRSRLLPHVAARIFNTPLAIEPSKLSAILAGIGPRLGLEGVRADMPPTVVRQDRSSEYAVTAHGVAIVPVFGTIAKRNEGGVMADSGLVSMEAIRETLATALVDPKVSAIVMQFDSYGGEAIGTSDLANFIFASRGTKPLIAVADDAAYSAAYYLAAACDSVVVSSTGGVGSIGVVTMHVDETAAIEAEGLVVTPIFAGDHKIDGAGFAPLTDAAKARIQARVDGVYATFVADVAKFRGVDPALIRRTQAMTYYGADAIRAGLADQVATFDDAIAALNSRVSGTPARTPTGGMRMEHPTPGASLPPDKPTAEVIAISTAREQSAQAQAEGRLAGQQAEKLRCKTINGLATLARMPKATAQQLASRLIDDNSTVEAAQEAFLAAQVQADALASGGVELLGHTGAATVTSQVPVMQARANVIADRARRMSSRAALTRVVPQEGAL